MAHPVHPPEKWTLGPLSRQTLAWDLAPHGPPGLVLEGPLGTKSCRRAPRWAPVVSGQEDSVWSRGGGAGPAAESQSLVLRDGRTSPSVTVLVIAVPVNTRFLRRGGLASSSLKRDQASWARPRPSTCPPCAGLFAAWPATPLLCRAPPAHLPGVLCRGACLLCLPHSPESPALPPGSLPDPQVALGPAPRGAAQKLGRRVRHRLVTLTL